MSVRHYFRNDVGLVELIDQVQMDKWKIQVCAEEGRVGQGSIEVDDPDGTFDVRGHRTWIITESDIPDTNDQVIARVYTADRSYTRGPGERVGPARVVTVATVDQNSILARRIQVGSDTKRPAEKDVARIQWLADTAEAGIFDDTTTYVHTDRKLSMDAVDYLGQPNLAIIDDCAQATGKNYWADFINTLGITLWYGHPGEPDWVASIAISNDAADVNNQSVFAPSEDATLVRDPSRIFSGVFLPYDGGNVYRRDTATQALFAARDASMPSINVKTAAKAAKRAVRYLADADTEDDRIACTLYLPSTHVNRIKPGQWVNAKFTHFDGYETFTPMRCLSRTIQMTEPEVYKMDLELSGGDVLPPAGNGAATLYFPMNRDSGVDLNPQIVFDTTGDDPGLGRAYYPLVGDALSYHVYSGAHTGEVWDGIMVETDGTVDITFRASLAAVATTEIEMVWTVFLDGSVVGTTSVAEFHSGPGFVSQTQTVTVNDLAVTAGQLITCAIETTGTFLGGYKSPAGVGGPDEHLTVVGTFE